MRLFLVYVAIGVLWSAYQMYGSESGAIVRTQLAEEARTFPLWRTAARWFGIFLGTLLWPMWLALSIAPHTFPKLTNYVATGFRRTYLDRADLFKPQMPAPRCPVHDLAVDVSDVPCVVCSEVYNIGYCVACFPGGGPAREDFVCNDCVPKVGSCPWCKRPVIMVDDGESHVKMGHRSPACASWTMCFASPDPSQYIRDAAARGEIEAPKEQL